MADAAFVALSVLTIGSAIAALELRSLVYGSLALMGTLGGIAGFFLMLDAPFVALFQIAVYVGSIAVLILFTVMLVRRQLIFTKVEDVRRRYAGIGLMLVVMLALGAIVIDSGLKQVWTDSPPVEFQDIGEDLLTYYWPALVLMGLILASSVTGALVLARREDEYEDDGGEAGGEALAVAPAATAGAAPEAAGAPPPAGGAAPAPPPADKPAAAAPDDAAPKPADKPAAAAPDDAAPKPADKPAAAAPDDAAPKPADKPAAAAPDTGADADGSGAADQKSSPPSDDKPGTSGGSGTGGAGGGV